MPWVHHSVRRRRNRLHIRAAVLRHAKTGTGRGYDLGNSRYGGMEALMVFDNVFRSLGENVIMCGETEFAGALVERFAGYHRVSYGGCKVGVGDVLIGAAALAAEYNGTEKASHIKKN